ncbi:MAG: hypothetical protein Q4G33_15270 [bacterium]|nr:hypothetical protein [bacterium]
MTSSDISYVNEDFGFYPTPPELAKKMIADIDFRYISSILEPSAGKGDILREVARKVKGEHDRLDVDCIEIDPNLRQILKYNFSYERKLELNHKLEAIKSKRKYDYNARKYKELTAQENTELNNLSDEKTCFFDKGIHIVHDNFLTYKPFKKI